MEFPTLIGEEWRKDIFIGVVVGLAFVLLNILSPSISIGLPSLGLSISDTARLVVVGLLAPIIEEIVFRGAFFGLFLKLGSKVNFSPTLIAGFLTSIVFALYHLTAYGGSIASASGAFIGAMVFSVMTIILILWRKNLLVAMIPHSIFNVWLLSKLSVVLL